MWFKCTGMWLRACLEVCFCLEGTLMSGPGSTFFEAPTQSFRCGECFRVFCFDCDTYIHESLHNCPGCECLAAEEEDAPME